MSMNLIVKTLLCTSAISLAGITNAFAHQHEAGETAAEQITDSSTEMAAEHAKKKLTKSNSEQNASGINKSTDAIKDAVKKNTAEQNLTEKASDMAMDKAKGMAKKEVLGDAGTGVAAKMEHAVKEKTMDHAMDSAGEHVKGAMFKETAAETPMTSKAQEVVMETPAVEKATPVSQPGKLLSFDEALSACAGSGDLQACIDERTGQGALRAQMKTQNGN